MTSDKPEVGRMNESPYLASSLLCRLSGVKQNLNVFFRNVTHSSHSLFVRNGITSPILLHARSCTTRPLIPYYSPTSLASPTTPHPSLSRRGKCFCYTQCTPARLLPSKKTILSGIVPPAGAQATLDSGASTFTQTRRPLPQ